jgi:hypothetical protein
MSPPFRMVDAKSGKEVRLRRLRRKEGPKQLVFTSKGEHCCTYQVTLVVREAADPVPGKPGAEVWRRALRRERAKVTTLIERWDSDKSETDDDRYMMRLFALRPRRV